MIRMTEKLVREYIEELKHSEFESYLEGCKEREINYMQFHSYRFKEVLRSIPVSRGRIRILDIGTTPFTILLKRAYPHYEIWTIDRTDLMKKRCLNEGVFFKTVDLSDVKLPFEDSYFDVIIFTEVLEHLCVPPSLVLAEVKRVLRPGGKLLLSVPNIATLHKRLKLLFGKNILPPADRQLNGDKIHGYGHLHEYTMGEIEAILRGVGFKILKKRHLQPPFRDALKASEYLGGGLKLKVGMAISALTGYVIPSMRPTIYIEGKNPG